jgi:thioesterase domain-containing protein
MATHYINEIRSIQPAGPYAIGGRSFGGMVAFEMARQLHAGGHQVSLLALFDTHREHFGNHMILSRRIQYHLLQLAARRARDRFTYFMKTAHAFGHRVTMEARLLTSRVQSRIASEEVPKAVRLVQEAIAQAATSYVQDRYAGSITLFRAAEGHEEHRASHLRWAELAGGGVTVIDVPGSHNTLLQAPHVLVLADRLRRAIEEAGRPQQPRPPVGRTNR